MNYEEKLKELRFNFRPEEVIDYETLISLAATLFHDENEYEKNKEELFHTFQILVLVYGLEDQLLASNFIFDKNNINLNNLDLWKYLTVTMYNDLEKTSDFILTDETKNAVLYVLNLLEKQLDGSQEQNNSQSIEPEIPSIPVEEQYHFVEPDFSFNANQCNENLNNYNWDYLPTYIKTNNLMPYKCACCGLEEWQNKPLNLILSKKNKNGSQDIDNLEFLCPNCYSQIGK